LDNNGQFLGFGYEAKDKYVNDHEVNHNKFSLSVFILYFPSELLVVREFQDAFV